MNWQVIAVAGFAAWLSLAVAVGALLAPIVQGAGADDSLRAHLAGPSYRQSLDVQTGQDGDVRPAAEPTVHSQAHTS